MRWTLLVEHRGRSGADNMAIDTALLRHAQAGRAFLRLYGWDPPCLSFGRNEPVKRRYDLEAIKACGIDTVRRPTGGRAVWHDREVTYAVAAPEHTFGSLREAYYRIHDVIARGLARLGVEPGRAPMPTGPSSRAGSCFASPMGGEILVNGRKLVGSAQYRQHGAFLQHGSILLEDGQTRVTEFLLNRASPPTSVGLSAVLDGPVSPVTVASTIAGAARSAWVGDWCDGDGWDPGADPDHYRDPAWTWRR